ncbi:hypothetical protein CPC735_054020 [Coccidioides posadasii C735 delta SOWgp]|uniref:Phosphatidate phosphatase APP1 catalytic domain-containing protein n=1 Tax=Coccidioides posadasii (strain C735) TaxID=222929 RepID=C5PHM9_COCP7|nr:hypothetical protein CPC735_054020 [Coccidioides posadasii C735 delta SOWgp]EER24032.1 hypothetical protein CPC735_054020 [Coccidioides posadasii C735 delta SOWgp]|eukprot:XP_003066177.1 hypothetical protein CPC735_054020 [Coccidioides posadasii C735 delta SOWgp]
MLVRGKMGIQGWISICLVFFFFLLSPGTFSGPTLNKAFASENELDTTPLHSSQQPEPDLPSDYEWKHTLRLPHAYLDSMSDNMQIDEIDDHLYGRPDIFSLLPSQEETREAVESLEIGTAGGTSLQAMNIPQYANWTGESWFLRFRGYIFTQPVVSNKTIEKFTSRVLGFPAWTLKEDQYLHAMQMARGMFVLLQPGIRLSWRLISGDDPQRTGGESSRIWPPLANVVIAPNLTDFVGDYDFFADIGGLLEDDIQPGGSSDEIQPISFRSNATTNAGIPLSFLVPPSGYTIVSDIDDVLRVSTIYHPTEGFRNLLTRPFYPWMNMPDIFANWSHSLPDTHFHYLTTAPDQMAQRYMDFIFNVYPHGSFDMRAVNFRRFRSSWSVRSGLLEKVLQTYPERKFILIGDNSNHDIMKNYPLLSLKYPGQIQCIFIRNVSATDRTFRWPYTTKFFQPLNRDSYMIFRYPDDLANLDIESGHCNNESVPQHLTYGWQGLPWRS